MSGSGGTGSGGNSGGETAREPRRGALRAQERLNGIDYVEIGADRRTLKVVLFRPPPDTLTLANFVASGGVRVRDPAIRAIRLIEPPDPDLERAVRLVFAQPGDSSVYRLQIRDVPGFDPRYARIDFTFGDSVDLRLDCVREQPSPPAAEPAPELDYLAKDYAGFKRLAYDRLAQTLPGWSERHVPDLGVMLVEMMAYVGDQLSYYQDAVATEAYLGTARLRTSVRRHARLIDYMMHEGCNARTWVHVATDADLILEGSDLCFAVGEADPPLAEFQPMASGELRLYQGLNRIEFHAWGDGDCCLRAGATSATLRDGWPIGEADGGASGIRLLDGLRAGDALLIEIVGVGADPPTADPALRHVVRLHSVRHGEDPLHGLQVVEVAWAAEDALPFDAPLPAPPGGGASPDMVAIARGNILLADHGRMVEETLPGRDPPDPALWAAFRPGPRRPRLARRNLTFRQPPDPLSPATRALRQEAYHARPQVSDMVTPADPELGLPEDVAVHWTIRPDLIGSGGEDAHVVVEMDDDGAAGLRFGDGRHGMRPGEAPIEVRYRVGNGPEGNVGAETVTRVLRRGGVNLGGLVVRNPLPAVGGTAAEAVADVKLLAPSVLRARRERAVIGEDYARAAEEVPGVRRAAADLRQLGATRMVDVAILPTHGMDPAPALLARVRAHLDERRRIGHDVRAVPARMVALDVAISVGVLGDYLRGHVLAALRAALGAGEQAGGERGLFHPDGMSFGSPVHASRIVAAAQAVTGVEWVRLTRLRRLDDPPPDDSVQVAHAAVSLLLDAFEVARLDNDSEHPEHGRLAIALRGGR